MSNMGNTRTSGSTESTGILKDKVKILHWNLMSTSQNQCRKEPPWLAGLVPSFPPVHFQFLLLKCCHLHFDMHVIWWPNASLSFLTDKYKEGGVVVGVGDSMLSQSRQVKKTAVQPVQNRENHSWLSRVSRLWESNSIESWVKSTGE